ncbi:hypothetical protein C5C31_11720 [Rathayibacter rathayi]|uniref:Ribbon-helix-helix protein CopG domain-containing protein n=1 Tax=Rathayibacter rathayi TaxID=33887 RepID=A0ABX5AE34_RATRA|nr:hypothetical protein [Rathayibacter rathayi]MWV75931.1 hypothetical protein [Rathayibacter rathayi NCPPB 2980 = VKM Ac-1601]PPG66038.1 hypothetical protein C5C16_12030 [Rathayibacter rathayi]PPG66527.1 hypothetical protein C5C02_11260 [Rathayibacter rathayi]PPG74895.1 hypothetical protein C5C23_11835 [Rathayibacter rathayi]PPG75145.1 hypothetical protein C5C15_13415 [Rathayibacter rathayi]
MTANDITTAEATAAARASDQYEQAEAPQGGTWTRAEGDGAGRALLEAALGSADAVEMAIGRPRARSGKKGITPTRSVRWGVTRIQRAEARAATEGTEFSELARRALDEYLERHTA